MDGNQVCIKIIDILNYMKNPIKVGIIFDVMVTGVTGAGKSTTLNALFQKEISKVGRGVEPETMTLDSYKLNDSF
ncbi:MAG: hypothetical protein Q9M36_05480 [Sulfurovum sp.]|nr:hypothetical protein [Sulfurovum sp.]